MKRFGFFLVRAASFGRSSEVRCIVWPEISKLPILLLAVIAACASEPASRGEKVAADGSTCVKDRAALLALGYWEFDQSPEGVRAVLDKPGCQIAGADLIRDFHAALRAEAKPVKHTFPAGEVTFSSTGEMTILYWHEGQARAMAGQTPEAIRLFRLSLKPAEENFGGWNEYVRASIAFLSDDLAALQSEREALNYYGPIISQNLTVVDRLVRCFGQSYQEAYGTDRCSEAPDN